LQGALNWTADSLKPKPRFVPQASVLWRRLSQGQGKRARNPTPRCPKTQASSAAAQMLKPKDARARTVRRSAGRPRNHCLGPLVSGAFRTKLGCFCRVSDSAVAQPDAAIYSSLRRVGHGPTRRLIALAVGICQGCAAARPLLGR